MNFYILHWTISRPNSFSLSLYWYNSLIFWKALELQEYFEISFRDFLYVSSTILCIRNQFNNMKGQVCSTVYNEIRQRDNETATIWRMIWYMFISKKCGGTYLCLTCQFLVSSASYLEQRQYRCTGCSRIKVKLSYIDY